MRFTKGNHAFIVCTHIDKAHIHNHIIFNSTSLDCTRKFRNFWGSTKAVRRLNDIICIENGYSIVENPRPHGKSYNKWQGDKAPCQRDQLRMAIDTALKKRPADLEALLALLREMGIEVSPRGKSIRLRGPGGKKFIRLDADSMGEGYSVDALSEALSGKRTHAPSKKKYPPARPFKGQSAGGYSGQTARGERRRLRTVGKHVQP